MYAMVCHSGVLGGGHYVSYGKTSKDTWYCHNDSSCKEVSVNNIDKSTAYILLYEREGLSISGMFNVYCLIQSFQNNTKNHYLR